MSLNCMFDRNLLLISPRMFTILLMKMLSVVRSFVDAASGEGCSRHVAAVGESDLRTTGIGVKRNLEGSFVEIDSDDEPLSQRYGKLKQG